MQPRKPAKPSTSDLNDTSPLQGDDVSTSDLNDTLLFSSGDGSRLCSWCANAFEPSRRDAVFCSVQCRQSAWRLRQRHAAGVGDGKPKRFAYADPPYPGFAARLYKNEPTFAGEVDHNVLMASLVDQYDGWALSTGAYALQRVLPMCPAGVRVCAWVKPIGVSSKTFGLHNTWEPVIVSPGRELRPGKRDWLSTQPARHGGDLIGRKPIAFAAFLFAALGMLPGDELVDLFPGTGVIGRAWAEMCRQDPTATASSANQA